MRPPRPDIAVPPFPPGLTWIGDEPPAVERLTARGPVLVHFVDLGHLSSVRTLPYLRGWHDRYADEGLSVLAVNSPRFPFTGDPRKLALAAERLELPFPLACDSDHLAWRAYGCEGWPSTFLWGRGGTLRWFQFGEGEYAATETELRSLLSQAIGRPPIPRADAPREALEHASEDAGASHERAEGEAPPRRARIRLPEPMEPLRPSDVPGAGVLPPTPEVFPGGDPSRPWRSAAAPASAARELRSDSPVLELDYEGAGAAVTLDGAGELVVSIDEEPERAIPVAAPGVHQLAEHARHGSHRLRLRPSPGLDVYCVAFAPGVA